jgi:NADH:ubiquinone oxidoreductase subunit 6 (subunit J)
LEAVRAAHLLDAVLWLALVSALIATMFYSIGAWQIAAIELSVGTGLVTVLMVFAITMVGNERETITRQRLSLLLVISVLLLTLLTVPFIPLAQVDAQEPLSDVLWQERGLDLILQVVLIFSGVLGVIDLLGAAHQTQSSKEQEPKVMPAAVLPSEPNFKPSEKEAA